MDNALLALSLKPDTDRVASYVDMRGAESDLHTWVRNWTDVQGRLSFPLRGQEMVDKDGVEGKYGLSPKENDAVVRAKTRLAFCDRYDYGAY